MASNILIPDNCDISCLTSPLDITTGKGQKAIIVEMRTRFETVDKRFESMNKRFESMDKHFESVDKRFEMMEKRIEMMERQFDKRFESLENQISQFSARHFHFCNACGDHCAHYLCDMGQKNRL